MYLSYIFLSVSSCNWSMQNSRADKVNDGAENLDSSLKEKAGFKLSFMGMAFEERICRPNVTRLLGWLGGSFK